MDFEKLLIILVLFGFVIFLFPNIESAVTGISGSEPMKWLFEWTPYLFLGSVMFILAMYAVHERG